MNLARSCRRFAPVLVAVVLLNARPAHAVSKEMVQLQTEVQQLIDSLARLQQSNDEQMGVLKDLVQQTVDSVNKMSVTVNGLQLKMQNQADAQSTTNTQISGQVQALNDSLDELKARMMRMEKTLSDLQTQAQSTNTMISNLPGANGATPPANTNPNGPATAIPIPAPGPTSAAPPDNSTAPAQSTQPTQPTTQPQPIANAGPSVGDMYRTAYADYIAGKYPLATSEFRNLITAYPNDNLAGNAYFYIAEMDMRTQKPSAAVKSYDALIENYPDNVKIPAARLHKGEALIATRQTEAGVRELRALIIRYPNSPEAAQARSKLNALHESAYSRGRIQ